ncbi:DUF418 domain-containing protein [Shewanella maritima]|nr:DUF418 domain-containing protein [Shewanella maritima]
MTTNHTTPLPQTLPSQNTTIGTEADLQASIQTKPKADSSYETSAATTRTRFANLDAIRGLALLGIFFLNILMMSNSLMGYAPHSPEIASDIAVGVFTSIFLEGRFISLFSMLFGVALLLQVQKVTQHNELTPLAATPIKQRLKWLILFGFAHGCLLFPGDILLTYGVCGLLIYRYTQLSVDELYTKAKKFIAIGFVVFLLMTLIPLDEEWHRGSELFNQELAIWTGSYVYQLIHQVGLTFLMIFMLPISTLWFCSGLMVLGMALWKQGYFEQGFSQTQLLKFAAASLLLSALDCGLRYSGNATLSQASAAIMTISAIPMAAIYLHIIVKLCQNNPLKLQWLQNVGKLSLSLYILQSIIGVSLLRFIFPEWQSEFNLIDYLLLALGVAAAQLVIANVYVRVFKQGPLEKLLRLLAKPKLQ